MPEPGGDWISFRCACGKKLKLPRTAAGRLAKCPRCGEPTRVPDAVPSEADAPADSLALEPAPPHGRLTRPRGTPTRPQPPSPMDETFQFAPLPPDTAAADAAAAELTQRCPACGRGWPGTAKVCTECGVYLATGKAIVTTQEDNLDEMYMRAQGVAWLVSWLFVPCVYPIASEAFGFRKPYVIRILALLTLAASIAFFFSLAAEPLTGGPYGHLMLWGGDPSRLPIDWAEVAAELRDEGLTEDEIKPWLAEMKQLYQRRFPQPAAYQLLTHQFLHADIWHLVGNLAFLLVLGSRVNALIGQAATLVLYPLLGALAAWAQLVAWGDGPMRAMLGASGAIAGLAGMYLVFFPVQKVHMVFWWRLMFNPLFLHLRFFELRGFWLVILVFGWDVLYVSLRANTGVAHWAHLGGFAAGAAAATLLLVTRLVNGRGSDVYTMILGRRAWALVGRPRAAA
jgi:membrane associated rhomboid family serine protease